MYIDHFNIIILIITKRSYTIVETTITNYNRYKYLQMQNNLSKEECCMLN